MKKKVLYNVTSSLILEIVSVVCAFILPRLILSGFGSAYNGIVSSVTQFLSVVTLLRGGVGGVTRAALYRPLIENDVDKISAIVNATEHFMRKIAYVFCAFLLVLATAYPLLVSDQFDWFFSFSLVLILGITTIAQYYFGITYQFLLSADQKSYVYSILQTVATVLNTILSVFLINAGVEFRIIKLVSAFVFAAIPIGLYWYVHKNYTIIKSVPRDDSCINQRWEAFIHQVAAFIHTNTDLVLLTIFCDLYQVSIYSIYNMVVSGVKKFVTVFSSGMEAAIGKMIANKEKDKLQTFVTIYECAISIISVTVFACTAILITPFVKIYTMNITDTDYIQPVLGLWLVIGVYLSCIRLPYQNMVESAGHFKQTRNGAIVEAGINLGLSLALIGKYGAVGVAIGTAVAMAFRTLQYALYSCKYILNQSYFVVIKRIITTVVNIVVVIVPYFIFGIGDLIENNAENYFAWCIAGAVTLIPILLVSVLVNGITYRKVLLSEFPFALKGKAFKK